jgi:hypothetical protein
MVRLRRETRVGSVLHPTVPEPGRVSRRGAQSKKCRRKPWRGNRLPGGCCWFATSQATRIQLTPRKSPPAPCGKPRRHRRPGTVRQAIGQANDREIEIGRQAAQVFELAAH